MEVIIKFTSEDSFPKWFFFVSKFFPKYTNTLIGIGYWKAYDEIRIK